MSSAAVTGPDIEIALIGLQTQAVLDQLSKHFVLHHIYAEPDPLAALAKVGARIRGAAGHGMAGLTRAHIDRLPHLEVFAISGVGLETTDIATCRARGITVTTATVLFDDVADLAIGLALAVCRQLPKADRYIRDGNWEQARMAPGRKLTGMRVGIAGLGRIGIEIARRLEPFKTEIRYVDPLARDVAYRRVDDLVTLAAQSDMLFLAAAGQPKGMGQPLVGRAVFDALGPKGIFINVARGWLVDEPALIAALQEGRLGAAGLDVFFDEPHVPQAFKTMENVVLSPHIASSTAETMRAMGDNVVGNLVSWFEGSGAMTPIGPG